MRAANIGAIVVILVAFLDAAVRVDAGADLKDLYKLLCLNQEVDLRRISDAELLIKYVKSPESSEVACDPEVKQAIEDLADPLEADDPHNDCTPGRIDRIISYIGKHIKAQDPTEEIPDPLPPKYLPKSLKRFFIAFSLVMSNVCKRTMLKLLFHDTQYVIDPDHYKEILRWTEKGDPMSRKFLDRATNYDDMFLVGNAICDPSHQTCRKLYIQTKHWKKFYEMRATCHTVFKPFYSTLILPFVRLANIGIDYQGHDIRDELDSFREDHRLQKWYKIVFICESLLNVVPLDLPEDEKLSKFHLDEEALQKLEEEEIQEEIEEQQSNDEEHIIVELDEPCDDEHSENQQSDSSQLLAKDPDCPDNMDCGDQVEECKDGKKVIKKKKKGNILTRFGKDIMKELHKLQRERKAYLLSKENMPVTRIMLKRDIDDYESKHGTIKVDDFGEQQPIDYKPKPDIHISDDLIPLHDKRIKKAIKLYEAKRRDWRKALGRLTRRYVRMFRRTLLLGRVKFGGNSKQDIETSELALKVFDKAMWERDNQDLVKTPYGKLQQFLDFQNVSNIATWVSLIAGITFSVVGLMSG